MLTQMQLTWRTSGLFLILTVLPCCRCLQVSIPQQDYRVANGGDISMICSFIPARPVSNIFILKWEAYPDNPDDSVKTVGTYFLNNQVDIAPTYEGRAFLEVDMDKKESTLRLTKVTMEDSRRFQCSVTIPNDDEGVTAASTSLLVLVPPSPPVCTIQGRTEYWQNINITCKSEEGSPEPVTEWKTFSVENAPRPFPPKTTQKDGVLSLFNISRETSGFFVCTSTNEIGSNNCNLTLAVVPASMNIASTVGIIGGVLAGIVVLAIIICCCCRRRAKNQKDAEGSPETVYYDGDAPEAGEVFSDKKELKQLNQNEAKTGPSAEDNEDRDSEAGSQRYQQDRSRGSRDHLDDRQERYGGSRDRLDDQRDRYGGSRDRLDDQRDRYGGSRDRLDDRRDRYGGSRDRLDDPRERYGGSRDRLDDPRERYGGSRDRLDERRDRSGGSRDRLDDSDQYRRGYGHNDDNGGHYRN
ncbi:hypothetical protein fugu_001363 [Takifugu bimaculatus]|uniref:Ig-like domain-containing protein n=1 Tax=Takifugu bimaculatus TaxID=433685 RepID=A0A4Z2CJS9_9TELE|nr:hypothetical protein fugu_001363 [Takifugu bimaculatus]